MKNMKSDVETYADGYRNTVAEDATDIMVALNHLGIPYPVLPSIDEPYLQSICGRTFTHKCVTVLFFRDAGVKIQVWPLGQTIKSAADRPYRSNPNFSHRSFRLKSYTRKQTGVAYSLEDFCSLASGNLTI